MKRSGYISKFNNDFPNDDKVDIMTPVRCQCISIEIILSDMDTLGIQLNIIKQNKAWNVGTTFGIFIYTFVYTC